MPTNPYNEYPINLGRVLALAYGIDARPYDTELQLWAKVAESLGVSGTPYDNLDAILGRIADAGGSAPCPPCPPCPEPLLSAEPDTEAFLSRLHISPENTEGGIDGVTAVTFGVTSYEAGMDWLEMPDLVSLSFPNLVSFGDGVHQLHFYAIDLTSLTTIAFPSLQTFQGMSPGDSALIIDGCPALTSVSFPSLVTFSTGEIRITDNSALTSISLPVWVPTPNNSCDFSLNALTEASVDHILARLVASPTWGDVGEAVDLSGGTNAPPGVQGQLDVATLLGRGASVSTE